MASSGPAITMKTHLDDPDVPDGWVRHTEPSGRIYYTSEMAAGVNTKLELKEKTYQEEYEISDSEGSEDSFTFEPYEQDSEEFAEKVKMLQEEDANASKPLVLQRVGPLFRSELNVDEM